MGAQEGKLSGRLYKGDAAFLSGLKDAELVDVAPGAAWALYLMMVLVTSVILWATLSKVDTIVQSQGKVVPDGREQVIASLEGGIIRTVMVREGMLVEQGQELLQLDPTRVEAQQNEGLAKYLAMLAQYSRLLAEAAGKPLEFPKELKGEPTLTTAETEVFNARRDSLDEALDISRRNLALAKRELGMSELMSSKGLMSDVEVMRLRRQVNDLSLQISERVSHFRQDARIELVRVASEMSQLQEQLVVKRDVLQRTTLTSPVRGLVKHIKLGTVGGVVTPGATIMEILPTGPRVLVEAKIKPTDIGFVRVGMPAEVKLTTYDYYTYGGLSGTIEFISPDALGEEAKAGDGQEGYYRALVRTDASKLKSNGKPLSVIPGMTASVDIRTGQRSVMEFLLKPVLKYQEAFRER
jgi:adhesin transport system membrane fusion protein